MLMGVNIGYFRNSISLFPGMCPYSVYETACPWTPSVIYLLHTQETPTVYPDPLSAVVASHCESTCCYFMQSIWVRRCLLCQWHLLGQGPLLFLLYDQLWVGMWSVCNPEGKRLKRPPYPSPSTLPLAGKGESLPFLVPLKSSKDLVFSQARSGEHLRCQSFFLNVALLSAQVVWVE